MRRREFIAVLGGAVITWPFNVSAQSAPLVGFVHARSRDETTALVAAFQKGLTETGYIDGQTVITELHFAGGQYDQLPQMFSDLVSRNAAVLVAGADPAAVAAKRTTQTVPIVFSVGNDPIALGLVASLNQPGGNATGLSILTNTLEPKRLGLLREILPANASVGLLLNPKLPLSQMQAQAVQDAARSINLTIRVFWAGDEHEMTEALNSVAHEGVAALMVGADPFFDTYRTLLTGWANNHKLPTMFQFREYALAGGLMSYGINLPDVYRQIGVYTGRILKGEKPAQLPVLLPSKFDFVINQKTAKTLGIRIPSGVLAIADDVIE
jgi:putative ABC transport system substrate-binding protein